MDAVIVPNGKIQNRHLLGLTFSWHLASEKLKPIKVHGDSFRMFVVEVLNVSISIDNDNFPYLICSLEIWRSF